MSSPLLDSEIRLPTSEELPDSDETPVDNENQNTIPNWLLAILEEIWDGRQDWFFGVDLGIYDREAQVKRAPAVVPDGFLSIGVQRHKREGKGRLSYVLQEENEVVPILSLEFVSQTYNQEYSDKMEDYAQLGVKYYVIYNPEYSRRHKHEPFEVYKLVEGQYQKQEGEPVWLPEIGLGIGRVQGKLGGIRREWLAWSDATGKAYPLPKEQIRRMKKQLLKERQRSLDIEQAFFQERERAEREQQRAERERQRALQIEEQLQQERREKMELLEQLRQRGINLEET
jgi:Uma2 family endonuclease